MEIRLRTDEIRQLLGIETPEFPKYATQIINLANQNAQATRPKVVGQMSELIKEFTGRTLEEWEEWYIKRHPDAIDRATRKILDMLDNFRKVMSRIDEEMVKQWVRDLVIVKTFVGLKFQEAVLRKIAEEFGTHYKLPTPDEESGGIDSYIGGVPVSLKPITYRSKKMLAEEIEAHIIFYEKLKDGLKILVPEELAEMLKDKGGQS